LYQTENSGKNIISPEKELQATLDAHFYKPVTLLEDR